MDSAKDCHHHLSAYTDAAPVREVSIYHNRLTFLFAMEYLIEPIGAQFANKDLPLLAGRFTQRSADGYRLHSVFQVSQPGGCLGGRPTSTYLAIYERPIK